MVEIIRRQSNLPLARMEQPRPFDNDDRFMAVYIAAHRLIGALGWSYNKMYAKLQDAGYGFIDDRKIRYWAQRQPELPEMMIRMGEMTPEDFPAFVRPFLRVDRRTASMAQERPAVGEPDDDLAAAFAFLVKSGVLIFAGVKFLDWLRRPRPSTGGKSPTDQGWYG